ncbi:MAG TPA: hypothetical protein VMI11_08685 [Actinomycetes bacterium]|nr:hypothetical protein [Actinomycetes bacterium]
MAEYTVTLQDDTYDVRGLGRLVEHDERSRRYAFDITGITLASVHHARHVPVLDQGTLGSCTGNAMTGLLGTSPFFETLPSGTLSVSDGTLDEKVAVELYSDATKLDSYPGTYPPTDTGSSGIGVAKAAAKQGWISGYQHTFDLDSALAALAVRPVIIGINWYEGFDSPSAEGELTISGKVRGGHEIVLDQLDVEQKRVWLTNSWGTSFGVHGRAFLSWDTFSRLLTEKGDCTVPVPVTAPAPTPTPAPQPDQADTAFWGAAKDWARAKGLLT